MRRLVVNQLLWILYAVQAFFIFPIFLGATARGDLDFWVWDFLVKVPWQSWYGLLMIYFYAIFYLAFFAVPYGILFLTYADKVPPNRTDAFLYVPVSVFATFALFHDSIYAFFLSLPRGHLPTWYELLIVLWFALIVLAVVSWRDVSRAKKEQAERDEAAYQERLAEFARDED